MRDLRSYDWIVVNSSAGKDSQAMLDVVVCLARAQGIPLDRIVVVHADLGRVEWQGTRALAEEHARHYGLRFEVVSRPQGDLLDHVEAKGKWPGFSTRYCTSDHKRDQVLKLFTRLVAETNATRPKVRGVKRAQVRILNCIGLRADESRERAKLPPFCKNDKASNGKRAVYDYLPVFRYTVAQVWARIAQAGTRAHEAYALGMPRLSCCFCIYAEKPALVLAGTHNRELLAEYVRVERKIGHTFKINLALVEVQDAVERGVDCGPVEDWDDSACGATRAA